LFVAIQNNMLY